MTSAAKRAARSSHSSAGFADVLRQRTFTVLYVTQLQSIVGDQLARVALAVLVYSRTGSDAATALTYAVSFLPAILGGVALGSLGDRFPRRRVMIVIQAARALLVAAMAVPGTPVVAIVALVAVVAFVEPAFGAAEIGHLASVLEPAVFRAANGLQVSSSQIAQVAGFALGGGIVAVCTPRGALLVDAATFAASALVIATALPTRVRRRPRPGPGPTPAVEGPRPVEALRWIWRTAPVRFAILLSCLAGFFVVPEGLVVPYVQSLPGAGRASSSGGHAGVLLAAIPLGSALGVLAVTRLVPPAVRGVTARWMAIGCGLPLLVPALYHSFGVAFASWFVSGLLAAYQVEMMTVIARRPPDRIRSAVIGVASASLAGAQGLGLALGGVLADGVGPAWSIALAGSVGAVGAVCVAVVQRVASQVASHHAVMTQ